MEYLSDKSSVAKKLLYLECRNNPKQPKISKYKPLFIRIF